MTVAAFQKATLRSRRIPSMVQPTSIMLSCCLILPLFLWMSFSCQAFIIPTRTTSYAPQCNIFSKYIYNHERFTSTINHQNSLLRLRSSSISDDITMTDNNDDDDDIYVMVNGMPGPMATAAAEACLRKGLQLSPMAMTGPNVDTSTIHIYDPITKRNANVRLISSTNTAEIISSLNGIRTAVGHRNVYAIDYTHPSAVNDNCKFYIQHNIPFVMGTTGGNRTALYEDVEHNIPHLEDTAMIHPQLYACVIAPNMGKQIVALQMALSDLATQYPGAFDKYQLRVVESHQKTKADTSGTAKAIIDSIKVLTSDTEYTYDDIQMIRNDTESIEFGIPEDVITNNIGHAYHTYTLTSPDNSVSFQLQHNVIGRTIYAEGTADAVKFLAKQIRRGNNNNNNNIPNNEINATTNKSRRRVYNMIDVLKEGALE